MEHHSGSVSVLQTCSVTHVNLENHHNLKTWQRLKTKQKVGLDCKDVTLPALKLVAKALVMVAAASHMALTDVMFVRSGNATSERDRIVNNDTVRERTPCTLPEAMLQFVEILRIVSCHVNGQRR